MEDYYIYFSNNLLKIFSVKQKSNDKCKPMLLNKQKIRKK